MARIRTIKPEFFTSEDIVGLSPLARLLYIATWCEADKEGRLQWKPRTMKLRYFPADDCDIDALARELVASGLVIPYGDGLAYIPCFGKHQHINPRESASTLPQPDASARVSDASLPVTDTQVGREGKGREGKDRSASATRPFVIEGVSESVAKDFAAMRKAKKAPITETALAGIRREADKAGYTLEQALATSCERGWIGFKAEWVAGKPNGHSAPVQLPPGGGRVEL